MNITRIQEIKQALETLNTYDPIEVWDEIKTLESELHKLEQGGAA
jgi:hypothetical protein